MRALVIGGGGSGSHVRDWSDRTRAAARRHGIALDIADRADELCPLQEDAELRTFEVDFEDVPACVELARRLADDTDRGPLVAVLAFREKAGESAAAAAAAVGTPWNSTETLHRIRRKHLCRQTLREAGFPQPACHAFPDAETAANFVRTTAGPWVVKPASAYGSEGVQLVIDPRGAEAAAEAAASYALPVLVEEFVVGREFSAEGLFVNGQPIVLGITEKRVTAPPFFAEIGHLMPADLSAADCSLVHDVVGRAVLAVGLRYSAFHVEFWLDEMGQVILGEVHGRTGGDWIHLLIEHCAGVDLFDAVLSDVLGQSSAVGRGADSHAGAAAVAVVGFRTDGVVVAVEGANQVRLHPDCLQVDVLAHPGVTARAAMLSSEDRVAVVVARGSSAAKAYQTAERLGQQIHADVVAPVTAAPPVAAP